MSRFPYSPRSPLSNRLAQLPWSYMRLASRFSRRISGSIRDLRIAIRVSSIFAGDGRDTFVFCFCRGRNGIVQDLKVTTGRKRSVVRYAGWRRRAVVRGADWRRGLVVDVVDPISGIAEGMAAFLSFPLNVMLIHLCDVSRK